MLGNNSTGNQAINDEIKAALNEFLKADDLLPILASFDAWLDACRRAAAASNEAPDDNATNSATLLFGCPWTTYPLLKKHSFSLNHSIRPLFICLDRKLASEDYLATVKDRMSTKTAETGRRNVLVCGGGPAGLRAAIECCLLRCDRVVVLEKRLRLTRYNVLHVWRFGLADLKSLGAKALFRSLGLGSLDVISIRRVQIVLLKIALVLGVKVFTGAEYLRSTPCDPPSPIPNPSLYPMTCNWQATFVCMPPQSQLDKYRYNILIDATGPTVLGQYSSNKANVAAEFSFTHLIHGQTANSNPNAGPTAIGITANFALDKSSAAERAFGDKEGGRVSYLNKVFFQKLKDDHNIEIENIAFYRSDESHYLVFTPRKQNLLSRGVLRSDCGPELLKPYNVDTEKLQQLCRDLATACDIPESCKFITIPNSSALDAPVRNDVNIFDFSTKTAATRPSMIVVPSESEKLTHPAPLLVGLVGDSLLAPFWPLGTGLAHATLSSLDLAYTISKLGDPINWIERIDNEWTVTQQALEILETHRNAYTLLTTATGESVKAPSELPPSSNNKLLAALNNTMRGNVDDELKGREAHRGSTIFKLQVQVEDFMEDGTGAKKSSGSSMGIIVIPLDPAGRYLKGKSNTHVKGNLGPGTTVNGKEGMAIYSKTGCIVINEKTDDINSQRNEGLLESMKVETLENYLTPPAIKRTPSFRDKVQVDEPIKPVLKPVSDKFLSPKRAEVPPHLMDQSPESQPGEGKVANIIRKLKSKTSMSNIFAESAFDSRPKPTFPSKTQDSEQVPAPQIATVVHEKMSYIQPMDVDNFPNKGDVGEVDVFVPNIQSWKPETPNFSKHVPDSVAQSEEPVAVQDRGFLGRKSIPSLRDRVDSDLELSGKDGITAQTLKASAGLTEALNYESHEMKQDVANNKQVLPATVKRQDPSVPIVSDQKNDRKVQPTALRTSSLASLEKSTPQLTEKISQSPIYTQFDRDRFIDSPTRTRSSFEKERGSQSPMRSGIPVQSHRRTKSGISQNPDIVQPPVSDSNFLAEESQLPILRTKKSTPNIANDYPPASPVTSIPQLRGKTSEAELKYKTSMSKIQMQQQDQNQNQNRIGLFRARSRSRHALSREENESKFAAPSRSTSRPPDERGRTEFTNKSKVRHSSPPPDIVRPGGEVKPGDNLSVPSDNKPAPSDDDVDAAKSRIPVPKRKQSGSSIASAFFSFFS